MEKEVDAANMALEATLSNCQQQMQQQQKLLCVEGRRLMSAPKASKP